MGVALLLESPVADEIDGLRRALGDPTLGRMDPHLTLVPPVNVRKDQLTEALRVLRDAAGGASGPLCLTLGAVATFLPANPVLYLPVGGDLEALTALRDAVFRGPLERRLSWPWVPHVTVADGIAEDLVASAVTSLRGYTATVEVDRIVMLEEAIGRSWKPLADAALGRPSVVGTGGLALSITSGRLVDPEVAAMIESDHGDLEGSPLSVDESVGRRRRPGVIPPIVHTAHREGIAVGLAAAWVDESGAHVCVHVRRGLRHEGIGSHLLRSIESAAARAGWAFPELQATGPEEFYAKRSGWSVVGGVGDPG